MKRRDLMACALGLGVLGRGMAEDAKDEEKKEKMAKYVFNFNSEYFTDDFKTTPHAHNELKSMIERRTNNNVYVKILDGGKGGFGSALANSVKHGSAQGALLSVANLAPMVPAVDALNIPFWSAAPADYVRLCKSAAWNKHVLSKMGEHDLQVLCAHVVGARTATSTKQYGKLIKAPGDFENVDFRIPGSKSLGVFYKLTKARPQSIAWKLAAATARGGRYQALDPSIAGLYSGPDNLRAEIGVISTIESVHDGWVAIGNKKFVDAMDAPIRTQFLDAFAELQPAQAKLAISAEEYCAQEFSKQGVKIYNPTTKEREALAQAYGHTQDAWGPVKKELFGDNGAAVFDELYKAAKG